LRHAPAPQSTHLDDLAQQAGLGWATRVACDLRHQHRAVAGAWPGTMTEARAEILAALGSGGASVSIESLRALSHAVNGAARTAWRLVAERDPEGE
jgi:hypothetical protein